MPQSLPDAAQLRQLVAERAIQRVILDYGRGVDEYDYERIRGCFHVDATITYGGDPPRGRDEAIDWLAKVTPSLHALSHYFGPPIVDLSDDAVSAICQTWCINVLQYPRGAKGQAQQQATGLLYDDVFEFRNGVWLIAKRSNHTEWSLDIDGNTRLPLPGADPG
jgi:hypothetical protein